MLIVTLCAFVQFSLGLQQESQEQGDCMRHFEESSESFNDRGIDE